MLNYQSIMTEYTDYGTKIKMICRMRGITQGELAMRVGWHRVAISDFVRGKTGPPKLSSLEKLAEALDVKVGDFFESTGILDQQERLAPGQFRCPKCGTILEIREAEK